jgi:hypothetical protein
LALEFHGGRGTPRHKSHHGSLGLLVLYNSVVGSSAQARDAAQQEEEEEHADPNLRKVTIKRRKKGLRSITKMDFMRLRNDSYLAQMNVYLSWSSKEIHMTSDVFDLSNTKHLRRNEFCAKMMMWQVCNLITL